MKNPDGSGAHLAVPPAEVGRPQGTGARTSSLCISARLLDCHTREDLSFPRFFASARPRNSNGFGKAEADQAMPENQAC